MKILWIISPSLALFRRLKIQLFSLWGKKGQSSGNTKECNHFNLSGAAMKCGKCVPSSLCIYQQRASTNHHLLSLFFHRDATASFWTKYNWLHLDKTCNVGLVTFSIKKKKLWGYKYKMCKETLHVWGICCLRAATGEQLCAVPPCPEIIENLGTSLHSWWNTYLMEWLAWTFQNSL